MCMTVFRGYLNYSSLRIYLQNELNEMLLDLDLDCHKNKTINYCRKEFILNFISEIHQLQKGEKILVQPL